MRFPIPAIVVPVVVLLLYLFVPGLRERPWTTLRIAGGVLAVAGYALFVTARLELGKSFEFVGVMWFGVIVALHLYWLFVPLCVLSVVQVFRARREAEVLEERFGQTYIDYRRRTWL
jgi:protein-S-isoprenylcysteine O-methyltransferase Ste14